MYMVYDTTITSGMRSILVGTVSQMTVLWDIVVTTFQ